MAKLYLRFKPRTVWRGTVKTHAGHRPHLFEEHPEGHQISTQTDPEQIYPGNFILSTFPKTHPRYETISRVKRRSFIATRPWILNGS